MIGGLELLIEQSGNQRIIVPAGQPPAPQERHGTVRWHVAYTKVLPAVAAAAPPDAVWIDVSASDIAYYAALHAIWERGESFAVLEHDVMCRPDVIEAFERCPEPWCSYGYANICHPECQDAWANQLGCVRFRAELIEAVPDAMSAIPRDGWDWHNMCDGLGRNLRAAGYAHHWHHPGVDHRGAGWCS